MISFALSTQFWAQSIHASLHRTVKRNTVVLLKNLRITIAPPITSAPPPHPPQTLTTTRVANSTTTHAHVGTIKLYYTPHNGLRSALRTRLNNPTPSQTPPPHLPPPRHALRPTPPPNHNPLLPLRLHPGLPLRGAHGLFTFPGRKRAPPPHLQPGLVSLPQIQKLLQMALRHCRRAAQRNVYSSVEYGVLCSRGESGCF